MGEQTVSARNVLAESNSSVPLQDREALVECIQSIEKQGKIL